MQLQGRFPVNGGGIVLFIYASQATAPFTYLNGLKFDASGAVMVSG